MSWRCRTDCRSVEWSRRTRTEPVYPRCFEGSRSVSNGFSACLGTEGVVEVEIDRSVLAGQTIFLTGVQGSNPLSSTFRTPKWPYLNLGFGSGLSGSRCAPLTQFNRGSILRRYPIWKRRPLDSWHSVFTKVGSASAPRRLARVSVPVPAVGRPVEATPVPRVRLGLTGRYYRVRWLGAAPRDRASLPRWRGP